MIYRSRFLLTFHEHGIPTVLWKPIKYCVRKSAVCAARVIYLQGIQRYNPVFKPEDLGPVLDMLDHQAVITDAHVLSMLKEVTLPKANTLPGRRTFGKQMVAITGLHIAPDETDAGRRVTKQTGCRKIGALQSGTNQMLTSLMLLPTHTSWMPFPVASYHLARPPRFLTEMPKI